MKHKKSVLKILSANSECFRVSVGIAPNVPQIPEEGDFKIQNFQLTMNLNRSTKSDITTKPPFLGMCCYVSVFF
mgnify:CR=1 FL=1